MPLESLSKIKVLVLSYSHRGEAFFVAPGLGIEVSDADREKALKSFMQRIALAADDAMEKNLAPLFADHALQRGDYVIPQQAGDIAEEVMTLNIEQDIGDG
jgi:hypothetical protein